MFDTSGAPASDSQSDVTFGLAMTARGFSSPGVTTNASSSDQSGTLAGGLIPPGVRAFNPNADLSQQPSAPAESSHGREHLTRFSKECFTPTEGSEPERRLP